MSNINPVRIQRKRTRGFRLPPNTICISRPAKWGNPYPAKTVGNAEAVRLYRVWLEESLPGQEIKAAARAELCGKNLACFCADGATCHGDVLLEIANEAAP